MSDYYYCKDKGHGANFGLNYCEKCRSSSSSACSGADACNSGPVLPRSGDGLRIYVERRSGERRHVMPVTETLVELLSSLIEDDDAATIEIVKSRSRKATQPESHDD